MTSSSRILLVSNEPAAPPALESALKGLDCQLVKAAPEEEVLRGILSVEFAVILLDAETAFAESLKVARLVRGHPHSLDTPVIFLTASDLNGLLLEEAYSLEAVDHIARPLSAAVLRAKLKLFIGLQRKCAALAQIRNDRIDAALQMKDSRLRLILDNTHDYALVVTNLDGAIVEWDGAAQAITGWHADEALGQNISLIFTPEDQAIKRPQTERTCARQTGRATDRRWHQRKDGSRFFADGVMVCLQDGQEQVVQYAKIFRDVTQSKLDELERERLLKDAQLAHGRLTDVFRQAPAFMCVLSGPDHVFEMANERYLQLIGNRDAIGRPVREVLPEVADQGYFELLDGVYRSGESYIGTDLRLVLQDPDGSSDERFVDFVYMALRESNGDVSGILVHGVDQTERKRAEQAFRASQQRYRTVIESIDEGFCILEMLFDSNGDPVDYLFLETNAVFAKQTGLHNAAGKRARELVPDLDKHWFQIYGKVATTGESIRFTEHSAAMGRWFSVYATRIGAESSREVALVFSDITEQKKAEEDLRRLAAELSEANRLKSEFLATLAHELRNPLAPLHTGLEVLGRSVDKPEMIHRLRGMMDRQVTHMVHLVNDLLDVARITSGKVEIRKKSVDLKELVKTAVETSAPAIERGKHHLDVILPEEPLMLDADPVRIAQVLGNLLTNAAKYTPNDGHIEVFARREGTDAVISVSDTGIGIPPEALGKVFVMFNQVGAGMSRSQGGLGIGLSLVHKLVDLHGGSVKATSPGTGKGSTFIVRLPLSLSVQDKPGEKRDQNVAGDPVARMLRILIADDNTDAAASLAALLEMHGHAVELAYDGYAAMKKAQDFLPELAFLDIGMPGLNGYEVARLLRKTDSLQGAILVALTGWGDQKDRERSKQAGFAYHITKPINANELQRVLSETIRALV